HARARLPGISHDVRYDVLIRPSSNCHAGRNARLRRGGVDRGSGAGQQRMPLTRLAERDGYGGTATNRGGFCYNRHRNFISRRMGQVMADVERTLALFIDFENLALGFQGVRGRFDMGRVLKRMVEKGKIVAKKAYADWNRYSSYTEALHEAAIELIQIPRRAQTGKNSADIRLCVDAMDLAYSKEHIGTFVVVSGDSDFSPLVSKLKELGKHVIGLGMTVSTSELLRDNCDEFIYYEDLETPTAELPNLDPQIPEAKRKAFALLIDSLHALRRENKEVLWSSMIKDTMKRIK